MEYNSYLPCQGAIILYEVAPMIPKPVVDYRKFRPRLLQSPEFSHLKLLLFWPVFGLLFALAERGGMPRTYTPVQCGLDDLIPFCEWFLLPYLFWFVFIAGMLLYGLLWDTRSFRRMMHFTIFTYGVTLVIYFLFPTCQLLRPAVFPRDNLLTRFIAGFYQFDTNTNVCPSLHVCGAIAVVAGAWDSRRFSATGWRIVFSLTAALICASTVFMKQHSVLDVAAGLAVCVPGWLFSSWMVRRREKAAETDGNFH